MRSMGIGATFKDYVSFFTFCASTKVPLLFWFLSCKHFFPFSGFLSLNSLFSPPSIRSSMHGSEINLCWMVSVGKLSLHSPTDDIQNFATSGLCMVLVQLQRQILTLQKFRVLCGNDFLLPIDETICHKIILCTRKFFVFSKSGGTFQLTLSRILPQVDCVWFW